MVNAVNGHGNGPHVSPYSGTNQPSPTAEDGTSAPSGETTHPGKGKAGAPGQVAKQMLDGAPPAGFALGSLVSLIAQGDMEGAESLVNSLTPPPPAEEPVVGDEATAPAAPPEGGETPTTVAAVVEVPQTAPTEPTEPVDGASAPAAEVVDLGTDSGEETSIVDLFDTSSGDEEAV